MWKPDYATADELAAYQRIEDDIDDVQLALDVKAASRAIDRECNRQFGKVDAPEARQYVARWDPRRQLWYFVIDDLMDDVGVTVTVPNGAITAWSLRPLNAEEDGMPWTRLYVDRDSTVKPALVYGECIGTLTAPWGWDAVPGVVKEAALLQGSRFATRRNAPFGVVGSPELGSEIRLLAKVDPDVAVMLKPFKRRRRFG